ncbi:MAG: hypothetical protein U1E53_07170 [Dongiaceae bacterium]
MGEVDETRPRCAGHGPRRRAGSCVERLGRASASGQPAAALDLDLAAADPAAGAATAADDQPPAGRQLALELAEDLGAVDLGAALELAGGRHLQGARPRQAGLDTAFDHQLVAGADLAAQRDAAIDDQAVGIGRRDPRRRLRQRLGAAQGRHLGQPAGGIGPRQRRRRHRRTRRAAQPRLVAADRLPDRLVARRLGFALPAKHRFAPPGCCRPSRWRAERSRSGRARANHRLA